ncbi:MAG TPA: PKD domain-containing protein [Nitrososphaeraceae archaeon]|nr:PKD domain-containing protein [Nitrososphaeraceae archaeon]
MSIRRKGIGLPVLVVLIASSLVFAPMGYYYNMAGVINKVYAQEEGEEVEVTTEEEEPATAGEVVVDEQQPITATTEEGQQPLSASFTIDSTNGDTAPATFLFESDPEGGTEPYTFSWDFGDGSQQSNEQFITHTFQNPGTYQITLIVTDSAGQTASDTDQVTVQPAVPLTAVEIFANGTEGVAPATFEFAADIFREETRPYTFSWDFGDGQTATGEIVTHTFENPGTYDVRVLVTDSAGQTVTDTEQVTVQPMTTPEGQQLSPPTNATTTLLPTTNNQTISNATIPTNNTVVVNALLSALVALSPPQPPSTTGDDSLQQEVEAICTDDGGVNVTCPDVIIMITRGELLRCWNEEGDDRPGSYTEVICPGGEIEIAKNKQQLVPIRGPREMTID